MANGTTSAWRARQGPIRIGAVVALALAIAFVVWLLVRGNDNSPSKPAATPTPPPPAVTKPVRTFGPVAATVAKLRVIARARPVYWAGPKRGVTYELTQSSNGRTFIRYLPKGVRVGSRRNVLFVGTYAVPSAYKALQKAAKASGDVTFKAPRSGLAIYSRTGATNVYVAYPGSNYQIEVYDPNPTRARKLVRSGAIRPIS
ncbi:MAG TPA: hypothetical protein VE596_05540 [Gaiellaceae bacterium]|jgi:hypothetical protein|nr:hypothetical protein [Gaiellaceae bacterium]